jgi:hypothetical protein
MKKQDQKAIEYNAVISRWAAGFTSTIAILVISNLQLFKTNKTLEAKIYLSFAMVCMAASILCGLLNILVISFDLELTGKKFTAHSASKDKKVLALQFLFLLLAILFLFFILLDTL